MDTQYTDLLPEQNITRRPELFNPQVGSGGESLWSRPQREKMTKRRPRGSRIRPALAAMLSAARSAARSLLHSGAALNFRRLTRATVRVVKLRVLGIAPLCRSRREAMELGYLVDLSRFAVVRTYWSKKLGCTDTVWGVIEEAVRAGADVDMILHEICWRAKTTISQGCQGESEVRFQATLGTGDIEFELQCGRGDEGEPVLTLGVSGQRNNRRFSRQS